MRENQSKLAPMDAHRLVVQRLPEGSVPPASEELWRVDPPALASVRLVFGVGSSVDEIPSADDFHSVSNDALSATDKSFIGSEVNYPFPEDVEEVPEVPVTRVQHVEAEITVLWLRPPK